MRNNEPIFATFVRQALFVVGFVLFLFFSYRASTQISDPTSIENMPNPLTSLTLLR